MFAFVGNNTELMMLEPWSNQKYDSFIVDSRPRSVVLNLFTYLTRLSNKITRFTPMHSMVFVCWKYEINKLLELRMIYKNLHWLQFMVQ